MSKRIPMIFSMTGYAATAGELPFGGLTLELRSVNHRYLDLQFRMPDELRVLEPQLRERITGRISRGKVECRIAFNKLPAAQTALQLNDGLLAQLTDLDEKVRGVLPAAEPLSVNDVLRWPGMLGNDALPVDEVAALVTELLDKAVEDFSAARAREGEKLKQVLLERIAGMEAVAARVVPRIPQLIAAYQEKQDAKLKEELLDS